MARLSALAWPVMLASLNWTLLHLTDIVVVGLTGPHEVAAFGASRALTYIAIMVQVGALTGILVQASQADGAGDLPATGAVLRQGILLALGLSAVVAVPYVLFADRLLAAIGVAPDLITDAARVVRISALAIPAQLLLIAFGNFFEGISRPRRVAAINLSLLPVNAVLAWAWSGGHLGLPRLGAVGAALATLTCLVLGAIAMAVSVQLLKDRTERSLDRRGWAIWYQAIPGAFMLARFGAVPALASGLEIAGFSWLIALSTQLGAATTHAFQIIFSLHNLSFGLAFGFASAAGVRVGNAVGAGAMTEIRRRSGLALLAGTLLMAASAVFYLSAARPLVGLMPAGPAVHILAAHMLLWWAPFILFDGIQIICTFALRSLDDQVVAGLVNIGAFFIVTGVGGWWLVRHGYGADGLVIASGAGMVVAAAANGTRLWWITRPARLQALARCQTRAIE